MNWLLYAFASGLIAFIRSFPVTWVARLGRCGGGLIYLLDARHRKVAIRNLTMCFGQEKSAEEIRALARENFRRIGENFAAAVKTSSMRPDQLHDHLEIKGVEKVLPRDGKIASRIVAIGHFGNFELFAHASTFAK